MNLSSNSFAFFNGMSNGSFLHGGGRGSVSSISGACNEFNKFQINENVLVFWVCEIIIIFKQALFLEADRVNQKQNILT